MKELHIVNSPLRAIVDDADFFQMIQYQWRYNKKTGYVHARTSDNRYIYLHRLIKGVTERNILVDHWDRNKLNNRRSNLRVCTRSQNCANKKKPKRQLTSIYKGVCWCKRKNRWRVVIKVLQKSVYVGMFETELAAAQAYDRKAREAFGQFALTNFKEPCQTQLPVSPEPQPGSQASHSTS